ncbi:hypothetical protein EVAR_82784_1 [Eumeta japonica]|uniref:Uncharacterized protein n=1 Tax=Eumeta variegata TaxID=151549 RepID=A0A4C1UMU7_EUMVA|nr:hypothetical protein EVAR_82784_1 [Eumeta japonica]
MEDTANTQKLVCCVTFFTPNGPKRTFHVANKIFHFKVSNSILLQHEVEPEQENFNQENLKSVKMQTTSPKSQMSSTIHTRKRGAPPFLPRRTLPSSSISDLRAWILNPPRWRSAETANCDEDARTGSLTKFTEARS